MSSGLKTNVLKPIVLGLMRLALRGNDPRPVLLNQDDIAYLKSSGLIDSSRIYFIPGAGVNCVRFKEKRKAAPGGEPVRVLLAGSPAQVKPSAILEPQIQRWVKE